MQLQLTARQAEFRTEVADFLASNLPQTVAQKVKCGASVTKQELGAWTRTLHERGWVAPNWPKEHGGTGWSLVERHLFDVECRRHHAPVLSAFGLNMVGPAIIKFGSEAQAAEHLPKILRAERWWCQGYSEPQAGSDLAGLQTRAERDGDEYVLNGSKIWTSDAENADWIFCLVRTDTTVQKQRGISFLLFDIRSPGVTIEPLYAFNGKRLWNQVFFDNVRVPVSQRLGEENRGWTIAKSLLGDERLFVSRVAENKRLLAIIRERLALVQDKALHQRADALDVRLQALEMTSLRILSDADAGGAVGAEPSMLKLKGSELVQAMDELLFTLSGERTLPQDRVLIGDTEPVFGTEHEFVASGRYHHRGYTIAGGSSEVQHNIIAKQVLGL